MNEPEIRATTESSPEEQTVPESENGSGQPEESRGDSDPEENPVMNFFKTLVSYTVWEVMQDLNTISVISVNICNLYRRQILLDRTKNIFL